nr:MULTISPECIES: hypothetical protein [unclassified Streptomyces]
MRHDKRGTIHQAYRDGLEDQLGALGLVLTPSCSGRPGTSTPPAPS